jgi:hypothetical protein
MMIVVLHVNERSREQRIIALPYARNCWRLDRIPTRIRRVERSRGIGEKEQIVKGRRLQ